MDEDISVPKALVDKGVLQCVSTIDSDNAQIITLQNNLAEIQQSLDSQIALLATITTKKEDTLAQIANVQAEIEENKVSLTALAKRNPPIQSALDLLNEHPEYGINWQIDS